ncbi:MAG TPA: ISAs1 family transposase [Thermomicrobiales bacterium]|nr:ISAs1 family transposase [Thermomicrobiales bacterium]
MDAPEYSSLLAALREVPDPRRARGRRHAWDLILTVLAGALASGQRSVRAIGQWADERAEELVALLRPAGGRLPSVATLRRALRAVDVAALERQVARFGQGVPRRPAAARWKGQAVDGKAVRGAAAHGAPVHLVSRVRHADGVTLGQVRVAAKSNEITAVPALLAGQDLAGVVVTMDALLTQRDLAAQIRRQRGHYLLVVTRNQPGLYEAIAELFAAPPPPLAADALATAVTVGKGHGRLERRTLTRSAALNADLAWPDVGQVLRRHYRAVDLATGKIRQEVRYALTSLRPAEATPAQLEALWRGHWTIENRVHYVRDVTLGEDAGQQRAGHAPQALAALRNGVLALVRRAGWASVADALRHYGAYAPRALELLGALPAQL